MTREGRGVEAGDEHIAGKEDVHGKDRKNIAPAASVEKRGMEGDLR
jgi:hypothetical protein